MTEHDARPAPRWPTTTWIGRAALLTTVVVFVAIAFPLIRRGALLGDDFNNCLAPQELGVGGFFAASWRRLGMLRLARFVEILLTTGVCTHLPFGVAIAVPLLFTLAVALLARGVVRDLDVPDPWPDLGGALWLLQPLGTESSLWPATLHVPLGLVLALLALRAVHRGRHWMAALAGFGAAFCVEQVIFALPLAAWLVAPRTERWRAFSIAAGTAMAACMLFALWPGGEIRLRAGLTERIMALANDPKFYLGFPAVGLGLHSIPLAIEWALPWSVIAVVAGGALGMRAASTLAPGPGIVWRDLLPQATLAAVLVALVNVPVLLNVPRQGSPRLFAPTWLVLAICVPLIGPRVRRMAAAGAAAGLFAAGAALSLALSVSVRLESADFTERAMHVVADRVPDGGEVAVCGIRRTVGSHAPRGAFAVHELVYDWGAERALTYYTGRRISFHLAGELWDRPCPASQEVDAVIMFDELRAQGQP